MVLLDLMLPGISGEELVSVFSEKTLVIVLSAKSGLDSKVDVLSSGAEDKTISLHISNIRSKLKKSGTDTYIQTVWGIGFKLF